MCLTPGLYEVELMWGSFRGQTHYSYCDGSTWAYRALAPQVAWDMRHKNKWPLDHKDTPTRPIKLLEGWRPHKKPPLEVRSKKVLLCR